MGLLDTKSRIVDTVFTQEGKFQLSQGRLRAAYYSFSDAEVFYAADASSGSSDATAVISFEQPFSLPHDQITFSSDDAGKLTPFVSTGSLALIAGQIVSHSVTPSKSSTVLSGSTFVEHFSTGSAFSSQSDALLKTAPMHVEMNRILGNFDPLFDDDGFAVSPVDLRFVVDDDKPIKDSDRWSINVNDMPSFFDDVKFSRLKNFQYMPPVNKRTDSLTRTTPLADYARLGAQTITDEQLDLELDFYRKRGYSKTLNISPTTKGNKVFVQIFEKSTSSLKKFDVVDFGKVNIKGRMKHVFFVGKVVNDDMSNPTFVHIFTMVVG